MDLRFSPEDRAFLAEVRAALREMVPPDMAARAGAGEKPTREEQIAFTRALHARGWATPHWPREWGGTGWPELRQMLFRNALQEHPAPETLSFGTHMVGPVIYTFGSEAQKQRFLPRIATLEDWWCQGFSEPGAGSDLASLKTRAVRQGDHYILDGQKTWTTLAQYANWIFVLVRTNPEAKKQEGISFLLVDMASPGVTVRPIEMIDGTREVNEVFFDGVKVPAENLVGQENRGWDYAKFLLSNERNGQARVGISKARLRRIRALAEATPDGAARMIDNAILRQRLAQLEVEALALEMTLLRVIAAGGGEGEGRPDPVSSILKIRGSELQQATTELLLDVAGPDAMVVEALDPLDPARAALATYLNMRKLSIYGGSNEVQRTIIAKTILGL